MPLSYAIITINTMNAITYPVTSSHDIGEGGDQSLPTAFELLQFLILSSLGAEIEHCQ